ncbi:MAG: hypothetical protein ACOYU3_09735 [Bacillota bacterium]
MVKKAITIGTTLVLLLGTFIALNIDPVVKGLTGFFSGKQSAPPVISDVAGNPEAQKFKSFVSLFTSQSSYSFSGAEKITGDAHSGPSATSFSCTVKGGNYAVRAVKNGHTYRQLFVDGAYTLVDDTTRTVYRNVSYIRFPGSRLNEAFTGKLTRIKEEIFNGNQVNSFELYKNGIVYALYFSKNDELIRCFYIYDTHEITIDFTRFAIGDASSVPFSVPAAYARRSSADFSGK